MVPKNFSWEPLNPTLYFKKLRLVIFDIHKQHITMNGTGVSLINFDVT